MHSITSQGFFQEEWLSSDLDELLRMETVLTEIAQRIGFSEDRIPLFIVAVTEALTNAILHGNHLQPDKKVRLSFNWDPKANLLKVEIEDEGEGFDPSALPDPTKEENLLRETGRGIFLMRKLSDALYFKSGGRCVEMHFHP